MTDSNGHGCCITMPMTAKFSTLHAHKVNLLLGTGASFAYEQNVRDLTVNRLTKYSMPVGCVIVVVTV
jgi:hypothetical protein